MIYHFLSIGNMPFWYWSSSPYWKGEQAGSSLCDVSSFTFEIQGFSWKTSDFEEKVCTSWKNLVKETGFFSWQTAPKQQSTLFLWMFLCPLLPGQVPIPARTLPHPCLLLLSPVCHLQCNQMLVVLMSQRAYSTSLFSTLGPWASLEDCTVWL